MALKPYRTPTDLQSASDLAASQPDQALPGYLDSPTEIHRLAVGQVRRERDFVEVQVLLSVPFWHTEDVLPPKTRCV